jgi:hypothetical protein
MIMTGYHAVRKRGDEPELLTTSWGECREVQGHTLAGVGFVLL